MMEYESAELKPLISEIISRTGKFPTAEDWQEIKVTLWNKQIKWLSEAADARVQAYQQEYQQEYSVLNQSQQEHQDAVLYSSTGLTGGGSFTTLGESADFASALQAGGTSALVSPKGVTTRTLNHPGI